MADIYGVTQHVPANGTGKRHIEVGHIVDPCLAYKKTGPMPWPEPCVVICCPKDGIKRIKITKQMMT